mmetsp:Transcript_70761/g.112447  ORF Transcript_70761/g.112447 Transcript_70761/m.112447 type:complete len:264 (-) Transcript_70761:457-1248(-)
MTIPFTTTQTSSLLLIIRGCGSHGNCRFLVTSCCNHIHIISIIAARWNLWLPLVCTCRTGLASGGRSCCRCRCRNLSISLFHSVIHRRSLLLLFFFLLAFVSIIPIKAATDNAANKHQHNHNRRVRQRRGLLFFPFRNIHLQGWLQRRSVGGRWRVDGSSSGRLCARIGGWNHCWIIGRIGRSWVFGRGVGRMHSGAVRRLFGWLCGRIHARMRCHAQPHGRGVGLVDLVRARSRIIGDASNREDLIVHRIVGTQKRYQASGQ